MTPIGPDPLTDDRPLVMFVCVGNSARSQMAEGFARQLVGARARVVSAGTEPTDRVKPEAVAVMAEVGIDISAQRPKIMDVDEAAGAARLVSMGCGVEESCPARIFHRMEDWGLDDPVGRPIEDWRATRDEVHRRVTALLIEQGLLST